MTDIVFKTVALPGAYVGQVYEAALAENGRASAVTVASVSSGSLPPGLSVGIDLRITGTPTKAGSYTFKVTLTDGAGAVQSGSLSITVSLGQTALRDMTYAPVAAQLATAWPQ